MNVVSFTPSVSVNNVRNNNQAVKNSYQPSFKGVEKIASPKKAGPIIGFMRKMYEVLYLGKKKCTTKFQDGFVYTKESTKGGNVVISEQYNMWEKTPIRTMEDNYTIGTRKKITHNPDKTNDIEIMDVHVPEHRVSVKYDKVADPKEYSGPIGINYGDKVVKLSSEEREMLKKDFQKDIDKESQWLNGGWSHLKPGELGELYNSYMTNPSVIGNAIISSPARLEWHLARVPEGMPYGIEAILEKIGK